MGEGWRLFHVNPVWKQGLSGGFSLGFEVGVLSLSELGHRRQGLEPDPSAETCWVGRAFPKEEPAQLVPLRPKSHLPGPVSVVLSRCSQSDIQGDLS